MQNIMCFNDRWQAGTAIGIDGNKKQLGAPDSHFNEKQGSKTGARNDD